MMNNPFNFVKMHALGNDFMLVDGRDQPFVLDTEQIVGWANRRQGIGFDQLILIEKNAAQLCYRFFNADGSEAEQCGNGQRAIALFLHQQGVHVKDLKLQGLGGDVILNYHDKDHIAVTFQQTIVCREHAVAGVAGYYVEMGNPHWVYHEPNLRAKELQPLSHLVNTEFEQGANMEAIKKINDNHIQLRVIERGVGETQACGSGACAAAIASAILLKTKTPLTVSMLGGDVQVGYDSACDKITLSGPARQVYTGQINR